MSVRVPTRDEIDLVADAGIVRIRGKRPEDFAEDFAWRMDPENARFDGNPPLTMSLEEFLRRMESDLRSGVSGRKNFSIVNFAGEHIGNLMYYNISEDREAAEIGISIGLAGERGRGIGGTATIAFLRYLWQATPFRRIYLHTLEWNERAHRCFLKAGFEDVARVYRDPDWFIRMEARREWWLLWDSEGRFTRTAAPAHPPAGAPV